MKKFYSLFATVITCVAAFAQTTVASDNFNYTGALTANGWVSHSGTAGQLSANGSTANLVAGNSEDANLAFSTVYPITAGVINKAEYSATINVASATGLTTTGDYFLMLGGTAGASVTLFYGRLYIKGTATGYTLGVLNNSGGTATPTYGTEIPYGTAANVTVTYTVDNTGPGTNVATLQINSQPLLTNSTGTSAAATQIASVVIRQAGNTTVGTGNISIDNLVAKTYPTTSLAVSDIKNVKGSFIKNTFVQDDEIVFGSQVKDVKIYNMFGQVVKTSTKDSTILNVAELTKGNYIVTGTVNNQPVSQKILKD